MTSLLKRVALLSPLTLLLLVLAFRASLLNYSDLVDPTESRYASVAQQMVLDGDWITPKLPQPEGVVPYMGKPPFHFWLTAASYEIFGVFNWTSRLPSFLAALTIIGIVLAYGFHFFSRQTGETAALVTISGALMFFLSGASVLDVTLSACVCASLLCFAHYFQKASRTLAVLLGVSLALGFLTKGPVALALFVFAVVPFLVIQGKLKDLLGYHWFSMLTAFFIIASPWFVISELASPGFTKYFFWNENFARYFISDYGDLYGGGHVHPRGASWVMLLLAFLPWTAPVIWGLTNHQKRVVLWRSLKQDKWLTFCLCWGLSPAIFFSFGRQLHVSYLLPGLPGLSLFLIRWMDLHWESEKQALLARLLSISAQITFLVMVIWGIIEDLDWLLLTSTLAVGLFCFAAYYRYASLLASRAAQLSHSIFQICLVFLLVIVIATPIINIRKSTNTILTQILRESQDHDLRIGVVTENNYSPYWLSKKWMEEGNNRIKIEFISNSSEIKNPPEYLLLKKGSDSNLASNIFALYKLNLVVGKWNWYQIK